MPAALIGTDIKQLLFRANKIRNRSDLLLGAVIGTLNQNGHDKLTIVASPNIRSLGLWIEQLVAESTGKEGKGVIPVNYEPLVNPEHYGNDRLFVYLRLEGDQNQETDDAMTNIKLDGQSLIQINLDDKLDIGTEFFRWQFATAVTAAIIGVHPFLQLTSEADVDLPIPDQAYSFRKLLDAQRLGDFQVLKKIHRPIYSYDLSNNSSEGIYKLIESIN